MDEQGTTRVVRYTEADGALVRAIATRLHAADMGFDPRRHDMECELAPGAAIAVSYDPAPEGAGPGPVTVASGPRAEVAELLRAAGYRLAGADATAEEGCSPCRARGWSARERAARPR